MSLGRPAGALPTRLRRLPVEETVSLERYGRPLTRGGAA